MSASNGKLPDASAVMDQIQAHGSPDPRERAAAAGVELGDVHVLRRDLLAVMREYLHLPDPAHVLVVLGVAATAAQDDADTAVWLNVVAPSSSAKTVTTALLKLVQAEHLAEITPAGLLSWGKGKNPQQVGLLSRVRRGVVTFPDLSGLLAGAQRGQKEAVFAMLREVFDGAVTRTVQSSAGSSNGQLAWSGRLTIIGAVTVEIDRQLAYLQALGERFLYVRLAEPSRADQRDAARKARRAPADAPERALQLASALVWSAQAAIRAGGAAATERIHQAIEDAAIITVHGRATVPRNGYGSQEITGPAEVEGIGRLVKQLTGLARGLTAIGLGEREVIALVRRVALDSMPVRRLRVLRVLARHPQGPPEDDDGAGVDLSDLADEAGCGDRPRRAWGRDRTGWLVSPLSRAAGMDRKATRRVLEEFAAIGLVAEHDEEDALVLRDDVADATRRWVLAEEFVDDVAAVLGPPSGGVVRAVAAAG